MEKKRITSENAPPAIGPYSQAIKVGDFLFISGQIGLTRDGSLASDEVKLQTKQAIKNLEAILNAAGGSLENVVKTTVYLKDMGKFNEMNEVYSEYFKENPPARATVEVTNLPKRALVEVDAIAKL
jgi:2-iminobutanoate/2-iminopropanoate deaminase